MKKAKTNPQEESILDILKRLAKRIEESVIDINDIKFDIKDVKHRLGLVEHNTEITKVDVEKLRDELKATENRLNTRITLVGDLITMELGKKIQNHGKRISRLETTVSAN